MEAIKESEIDLQYTQRLQSEPKYQKYIAWLNANGAIYDKVSLLSLSNINLRFNSQQALPMG